MSIPLAVARGTTRLLGGVLIAKALDFAFYLLLARRLGVAGFGLFTFAFSFTLLFNVVADFGFSGILAREVTRTPERLRLLLGEALRIKVALAIITFALVVGIASATRTPAGAMPLIIAMTAGMLINATALLFDALLKSSRRPGAAGLVQIAQSTAVLVAGGALLVRGMGPVGGALAYLTASLAHLAGNAWFSRDLWRVPAEAEAEEVEDKRWTMPLQLWREALPLALSGVFIAIYFRIDAVMLQAMQGAQAVGLYGGIYRLFEAAAPICAAYHSVLFPSLVRAAQDKGNWVGSLCQQSLRMLLLGAIGYSAFMAVESDRIIGLVLGSDYAQAAPGLAVLIWATPPALMSTSLLWGLAAVGRQSLGTWAVGVTALANVGLNLVLIPRLSFMGASMATVASEVLCFLMLCMAFRRGITPWRLVEIVWRPAVAALALASTLAAADPLLPPGIHGLALAAVVGLVTYLVPLIGLEALGRREASLLMEVLPLGRRPSLARRVIPTPPPIDSLRLESPPIELRPRRRSLIEVVGEKGVRNLLRIARVRARRVFFSAVYAPWLRTRGVRVGRRCLFLGPLEIVGDPRRITIGDGCIINRGVCLWTHDYGPGHGRIEISAGVALGRRVTINSYCEITIGEGSGLGDGSYVQDNDHGTEPGMPFLKQPVHGLPIGIGADVWIGAHAIVLKGVTIGDHAVIGAGSVVVKPIPANVVAVGAPCRVVKARGALPSAA